MNNHNSNPNVNENVLLIAGSRANKGSPSWAVQREVEKKGAASLRNAAPCTESAIRGNALADNPSERVRLGITLPTARPAGRFLGSENYTYMGYLEQTL